MTASNKRPPTLAPTAIPITAPFESEVVADAACVRDGTVVEVGVEEDRAAEVVGCFVGDAVADDCIRVVDRFEVAVESVDDADVELFVVLVDEEEFVKVLSITQIPMVIGCISGGH